MFLRGARLSGPCVDVVAPGAAVPFVSMLVRALSASIPYPTQPYRKELLERKRQYPVRRWPRLNAPPLMSKYLRYAERVAIELGAMDELKRFDEASAAFPNPAHIVATTLVLCSSFAFGFFAGSLFLPSFGA